MYRADSSDNKCNCTYLGKVYLRAGLGIKKKLIPAHPLTNIDTEEYYNNEPKFNGVYSRDNLSKIKNGAYVINLHEYADTGTHWITLYAKDNEVSYFDSFGVEYIPKESKNLLDKKTSKQTYLEFKHTIQ